MGTEYFCKILEIDGEKQASEDNKYFSGLKIFHCLDNHEENKIKIGAAAEYFIEEYYDRNKDFFEAKYQENFEEILNDEFTIDFLVEITNLTTNNKFLAHVYFNYEVVYSPSFYGGDLIEIEESNNV